MSTSMYRTYVLESSQLDAWAASRGLELGQRRYVKDMSNGKLVIVAEIKETANKLFFPLNLNENVVLDKEGRKVGTWGAADDAIGDRKCSEAMLIRPIDAGR